MTDAYETTGPYDALLIARFDDPGELNGFLAGLSTDDRVAAATANVVLRTACEYEFTRLLGCSARWESGMHPRIVRRVIFHRVLRGPYRLTDVHSSRTSTNSDFWGLLSGVNGDQRRRPTPSVR